MIGPYYYIYKITCTTGSFKDHYYIGQRICRCLPEDDRYKGSGTLLKDYYKKYKNDYIKEILCLCKNKDDLNEKESFYVGNLYKTDPMCLNLRAGGNQPGFSEETRKKMSKNNGMHRPEVRKKVSENHADFKGENNPMYGKHIPKEKHPMYRKHHTEEACKKISEAHKGKHWKKIDGKRIWY